MLRAVGKALELEMAEAEADRPRTRADCENGPRPCPWVSCRHHLYLDVNPATGSIKLNYPHLEVEELPRSCSLDVADEGHHTLEEIGAMMNLTRERMRQIELKALNQLGSRYIVKVMGPGPFVPNRE